MATVQALMVEPDDDYDLHTVVGAAIRQCNPVDDPFRPHIVIVKFTLHGWYAEESDRPGIMLCFHFGGVLVRVQADSQLGLIIRDWHRAKNGYIEPRVGPHPQEELSRADIEHDAAIQRNLDAERETHDRHTIGREQLQRRVAEIEAMVNNLPPLRVKDQQKWQAFVDQNSGAYRKQALVHASNWGRVMQHMADTGHNIEYVASDALAAVSITAPVRNALQQLVSILVVHWEYGEQLRAWWSHGDSA